jgi:alkylhydroperoxidase family enzyme
MKEDEIAALDSEWSAFTPARQAAYAFTRKLTYEPQGMCNADVDALRKHYTDLQILEMILSMAQNNSTNRWKEGVAVPQSSYTGGSRRGGDPNANPEPKRKRVYLSPTSEAFKDRITTVAPYLAGEKVEGTRRSTVSQRPKLEVRSEVEKMLDAARKRTPRLPLVDEEKARSLLPEDWPKDSLPQWVRLLANFPVSGKSQIARIRSADEKGDLKPLLKAQVSWIIARQDRAWYATGEAMRRLKALGLSDEEIFKLDSDWSTFTPAERAMFTVAKKLAASPIVLTDNDVELAVKLAGPRETVQLITYVTNRASFDRITEAAGLRLED